MKPFANGAAVLLLTLPLFSQPHINDRGISNAASYLTQGLPNAGIARGSIFVVFGQGLGPAQLVKAPQLPLPTALGGTGIRITAAGADYPAPMLYTSDGQLSAVLPSAVPEGPAQVSVTYNNQTSSSVTIQVRNSAFGIFTQNQAGSGPAIMQNYVSATEAPRLNSIARTGILTGGVGILWGTGLGPITGSDADVPPVGDLPVDVEVLVGGQSAKLLYKGRSPQFPGVDQINFEVPSGVVGCHVPLAVRAGGVLSNFASIAVVGGGTQCGDSVEFRGALLAGAGGKGDIRIGMVEMLHEEYATPTSAPVFWSESARRRFFTVEWSKLDLLPRLAELQLLTGTCTVLVNPWSTADQMEDLYPTLPNPSMALPTGTSLTLQGPSGSKALNETSTFLGGMQELGSVAQPRFLTPGTYSFEDANPPEPPARRASLSFLGEMGWTNRAALSQVDRTQDLTFQWSGGLDSSEYVLVGASSADEALKTRVTVLCAERARAGAFTIPAYLVGVLPKNTPNPATSFPYGFLLFASTPYNTVGSSERGTLDMLYFRYLFRSVSIVDFQ